MNAAPTPEARRSSGFEQVEQASLSSSPGPQSVAQPAANRPGSLAKVAIAIVGILCVGGLLAIAGTVYVAHRVHQKLKAMEQHASGEDTTSGDSRRDSPGGLASLVDRVAATSESANKSDRSGDPCRFLSKEDATRATGIEIIRTEAKDSGCIYLAKGDPADMVSKHMTAATTSQAAANGQKVSSQQQKMMQQLTGAFFKQQEANDKNLSNDAQSGEVPILSVTFSSGNADLEMKLNRTAFNMLGGSSADGKTTNQSGTGEVSKLGDEAYEMGGTGLIMRKGQTVVRVMFPYCPCDANAVKPLLTEIADKL